MIETHECSGQCGRVWEGEGYTVGEYRLIMVICEECWLRIYGEPAEGFTGFIDGWHLTVVKRLGVKHKLPSGDWQEIFAGTFLFSAPVLIGFVFALFHFGVF